MEFSVDRADINSSECKKQEFPVGDKQVRIKVEKFAFTSNNLTYASFGGAMQYWNFFPVRDAKGKVDETRGIIPVWGFGIVEKSNCEGIKEGDKFYGFYPMSSYVVMTPIQVTKNGFVDGIEYRSSLPQLYNGYTKTATDPMYTPEGEAFMCLNRPLFATSFVLDDFFDDNNTFGADNILITSASSKTSIGMAFMIKQNKRGKHVIGLTSTKNVAYVESLGVYNQVVAYDEVDQKLDGSKLAVYVDMSGNPSLRDRVHSLYEDNLKYSCSVGATHYDQIKDGNLEGTAQKGPKPQLFFAPSVILKRTKEWGSEKLFGKIGMGFKAYAEASIGGKWSEVQECVGSAQIRDVYKLFLSGAVNPQTGYICSFWDQSKM